MAGIVVKVIGTAMQAYSDIGQANIMRKQGKVYNQIAEYNAKQVEEQGKARMDAAKINADRVSRQGKSIESANIARGGKSGISISESKSTIDLLADTAWQFHLDRNYILQQGMMDYVSANQQASLLRAEGLFQKRTMGSQASLSLIGAAGSSMSSWGGSSTPVRSGSTAGQSLQNSQVQPSSSNFFSQPLSSYQGSGQKMTTSNMFRSGGF